MPDRSSEDELINDVLDYGITIFKALRVQAQFITDNAVANSALIQALSEQNPKLAEVYQRYFAEQKDTAPLARTTAAMCGQFDDISARLRQWKERIETESQES
jgi:hypothetical protein